MQSSPPSPDRFHVAIIMDGNGRWGLGQQMTRADGHRAGVEALRRTVEAAPKLGVTTLTVFAFSCDNWRRPAPEVACLIELLRSYLASDGARLVREGVRLVMLGRRDRLPADLVADIEGYEAASAAGQRMTLRIAFDYSARAAIAAAALALQPGDTLEDLDRLIAGPSGSAVDLMIRTGAEQRLSDFLLWECAYAELWFTDRMWPQFSEDDLAAAIGDFRKRDRRFGALESGRIAA